MLFSMVTFFLTRKLRGVQKEQSEIRRLPTPQYASSVGLRPQKSHPAFFILRDVVGCLFSFVFRANIGSSCDEKTDLINVSTHCCAMQRCLPIFVGGVYIRLCFYEEGGQMIV